MDRRYYLGVVASALLAGCDGLEQTDEPGSAATDAAPNAAPSPTETELETETETPTETPTPEGPNEDLESIAANVTAAVDTYRSSGDGDRLTDVRPSDPVSLSRVRSPLYEARETREGIDRSSLPPDEQQRYDRLEGAYWFAWWLGLTHTSLDEGYDRLEEGWGALFDGSWDLAESRWNSVGEVTTDAEGFLDNLKTDSDSADMAVFENVSENEYEEKIEQLEDQVDDSSTLGSAMVTVAEGFKLYASDGSFNYFEAGQKFDAAADTLGEGGWEPAYTDLVDDGICVANAMAAGCETLEETREAEDQARREEIREDASEQFDNCALIEERIDL